MASVEKTACGQGGIRVIRELLWLPPQGSEGRCKEGGREGSQEGRTRQLRSTIVRCSGCVGKKVSVGLSVSLLPVSHLFTRHNKGWMKRRWKPLPKTQNDLLPYKTAQPSWLLPHCETTVCSKPNAWSSSCVGSLASGKRRADRRNGTSQVIASWDTLRCECRKLVVHFRSRCSAVLGAVATTPWPVRAETMLRLLPSAATEQPQRMPRAT